MTQSSHAGVADSSHPRASACGTRAAGDFAWCYCVTLVSNGAPIVSVPASGSLFCVWQVKFA